MALDLNRLRSVARNGGGGDTGTSGLGRAGANDGSRGSSGSSSSSKGGEAVGGIVILAVIGAIIYWWRYIVVPVGAIILFVGLVAWLDSTSIESKKKWFVGIAGTIIIAAVSLYLWENKWPGNRVRQDGLAASGNQRYVEASWRCPGEVNVREGAGANGPGKGALSPKKFTQRCKGRVLVQIGSEAVVVQSTGAPKTWVRISTSNGEGWVNGDLVSY